MDLKLWIPIVIVIINLIVTFAMKYNDIKHVMQELTRLRDKIKELYHKTDLLTEKLITLETKCEERHK